MRTHADRRTGLRPAELLAVCAALGLMLLPAALPVSAQHNEAGKFYNAAVPPAGTPHVKQLTVVASDQVAEIAPGVKMALWTFNGSVPGPIFHVRQGG